jgi:hypothetical protein
MIVTFENMKVDGPEKLQDSSAKVAGNAPSIKGLKMGKKLCPIASTIAETRVVAEGSMAALTGIKSTDLDGDKLTFSWSQIPGLNVELNSKHASDTAFKSPNVEKILIFKLTVDEEKTKGIASDFVKISVRNVHDDWLLSTKIKQPM